MDPYGTARLVVPGQQDHAKMSGAPAPLSGTSLEWQAPQVASSSGLVPQLTRERWEELKPIIKRLYIDENRTQAYIADVLAESHGFRPT